MTFSLSFVLYLCTQLVVIYRWFYFCSVIVINPHTSQPPLRFLVLSFWSLHIILISPLLTSTPCSVFHILACRSNFLNKYSHLKMSVFKGFNKLFQIQYVFVTWWSSYTGCLLFVFCGTLTNSHFHFVLAFSKRLKCDVLHSQSICSSASCRLFIQAVLSLQSWAGYVLLPKAIGPFSVVFPTRCSPSSFQ